MQLTLLQALILFAQSNTTENLFTAEPIKLVKLQSLQTWEWIGQLVVVSQIMFLVLLGKKMQSIPTYQPSLVYYHLQVISTHQTEVILMFLPTDTVLFSLYLFLFNSFSLTLLKIDLLLINKGQMDIGDGTSASTPIFTGILSLVNNYLIARGENPVGFASPLLYEIAAMTPRAFYGLFSHLLIISLVLEILMILFSSSLRCDCR